MGMTVEKIWICDNPECRSAFRVERKSTRGTLGNPHGVYFNNVETLVNKETHRFKDLYACDPECAVEVVRLFICKPFTN